MPLTVLVTLRMHQWVTIAYNASNEVCDDDDCQDDDAVEDSSRLDSKSSSGKWANNDTKM